MPGKFDWRAFVAEILSLAPAIIQDVAVDKSSFGHEAKTAAAATATMQASQIAQAIDPADTETIGAATAVTSGLIAALKTTPPA